MHEGVKQKTIVEFICDREKTGLEGLADEKTKRQEDGGAGEGEGDGEGEKPLPDPNAGKSLRPRSYRVENSGGSGNVADEVVGVLRLEWLTKYACEKSTSGGEKESPDVPKSKTGGWGGFTWFIVV